MPRELKTAAPAAPLVEPMALLEHLPVNAYLLRAEGDDFVLEGVNATARARTPALSAMLGRPISLLYADQPGIIADAHRCHRERTRVVRDTVVRRHERVAGVRQSLLFASLDADHIVIYAQDSPDSETANAELYEVQERYRSLLASLPDAMLLRDADGRIVAGNETAARLMGYEKASDLWGKTSALAPGYRVETTEGVTVDPRDAASQRSARSGEIVRGELYRCIAPDGSSRWLRVSAQPVRKSDGSLAGSVTVYADETERVEARNAEREAAQQLQMALDAGRMGTWEYDPISDAGRWSPTLNKTFMLGEDDAPGLNGYLSRVHEGDREGIVKLLQEMLTQPDGTPFEHEHRLVGSDNITRWARIRGRVERHGARLRLIGTAMDVTERRRMQDELLHASRLESLGRLAGGLAHDFNNLLAAMLGTIELLGDVCPTSGQEDVATLRHITLRARDLTAQLLAFARQQRIELETLDVAALVRKVERLLQRLVGPTVDVVLDTTAVPDSGLSVRADAAQLEQVLVNLVINARDAMPEGGRITVRLASQVAGGREWVTLEVQDQGHGIDQEHLAHVFDPFFTTKETGTGLGLASSYGVIQTHGGSISVDSAPGQGATFKVRLPRVRAASLRAHAARSDASGKGRVLVVDDDHAVRVSTARMLQTLGYEVLSAEDGAKAEALAAEHSGQLDILVCDLAMPNKNGPEVADAIRLLHPDIKVLFVSGYPRGTQRELPTESFLQKPYDRDALARKLAALCAGTGQAAALE